MFCRHCFNAADYAPLSAEFSWEQCRDLIRQLAGCGVQNVTLTGGEPMLHPHFMDICREVDRMGMVLGGGYKNYDPAKCVYFNEYFGKFAGLFSEEWRCMDDIG